ncbi:hypothetical protein M8J77_010531 [Diaphorina citri]|nr:hypothetical protein M8J77_010531 [Diaphorina citri]
MENSGDEQRLFQMELQVGGVKWEPRPQETFPDGQVCTTFQFLEYPPLEICQGEFCTECAHDDVTFKSGKMMIFALNAQDLVRLHNNFIIHIRVVMMTLKAERLPFRTEVASAEMNISNDFTAILSTCFQPNIQYPNAKFINDEIDLLNSEGNAIGVMNLFLRLTSVGETLMGRMYSDSAKQVIVIDSDPDAQALVTQSRIRACPRRYLNLNQATDVSPICREYAVRCEDNNMLAARLYRLDDEIYKLQTAKAKYGGPQELEPGSVMMKGTEIRYEPHPDFSKSDNPTSVIYRMTSNLNANPVNQILQYINTPDQDPVTSIGPVTGLPPDGKVDVYVLRIGKKKYAHGLKTHLEVEVRTPKYVSKKKERFTKNTQYDKADLIPPPPPGKK